VSFREWVEHRETNYMFLYMVKEIGKVHPTTGHEGPIGEYRYSSTLSLTSAVDGGGQRHTLAALNPGKRPGTHFTGNWWVPGPVWTAEEIFATTGIRSSDRPARSESLYRLNHPDPRHSLQTKHRLTVETIDIDVC
jgi:hypothetical protein